MLGGGHKPDSAWKHIIFNIHSDLKYDESMFKEITVKLRLLASLGKLLNLAAYGQHPWLATTGWRQVVAVRSLSSMLQVHVSRPLWQTAH